MPEEKPARRLVIALGGNALLRRDDDGTIETQYARAEAALGHVARLAADHFDIALTHGNGPVVGNIVLRGEAARSSIPPMPLYIADADSEGGIGLLLQMSLRNVLRLRGIDRAVASLVTQVVVDPADEAFSHPTKPIGPYYDEQRLAAMKQKETSWSFAAASGGSWRRVVPSPTPLRVVEADVVEVLLDAGVIAIAAGGGGVPVSEGPDGRLTGVEAVVDKDWSSAVLALQIAADRLIVLMEADALYRGWGTSARQRIDVLDVAEAQRMLGSGELESGSIAPKVASCAHFASGSGREALICSTECLSEALEGRAGTRVVP